MVTIKMTNKAWRNQRLALAVARIVVTIFPAERQAQCPGKHNRECNYSHHTLWGQEEQRLQLWQLSLRGTWAGLHMSFSILTEDRGYTLASSDGIFFFCFVNNWHFCTIVFEAFIGFHVAILIEACSFYSSNYLNRSSSSLSVKRRQSGQLSKIYLSILR